MKRLPFVPVFSEYHSVIVPITISILVIVSGPFREIIRSWISRAEGTSALLLPLCAVLLVYGWWIGVRPGIHSGRMKSLAALGLFMTQVSIGVMLGLNGVQSDSVLSTILGGIMLLASIYRAVLFRLDLIDFEHHFADIDLQPLGLAISFSIATLVISLTVPIGLGPLETVSIAYLISDVLSEARKETLFDDSPAHA